VASQASGSTRSGRVGNVGKARQSDTRRDIATGRDAGRGRWELKCWRNASVTGASPPAGCLDDALVSTLVRRSGETSPQRHFCQADVAGKCAASPPGIRGADGAERGNLGLTPLPREPRIAIKGHLAWASILSQEGDHRFQGGLFVEILSRLGREGNRSAGIDPRCRRATTC